MSSQRSLLPLAAVSSVLLIAATLVITSCESPSSEGEATIVSSSSAIQATGAPTFSSVGLASGFINHRIDMQSQARRDVKIVTAQVSVFANGGFVPWHTHPAPGVFIVVAGGGTATVVSNDCSSKDYPTGTAFTPPHNIHTMRNNTSQPVELFATFIIQTQKGGAFPPPTTLEPAEVQATLDAKCGF